MKYHSEADLFSSFAVLKGRNLLQNEALSLLLADEALIRAEHYQQLYGIISDLKLTIHLQLAPTSRKMWIYTSTPPYALMA
jgi:hypothetical protein